MTDKDSNHPIERDEPENLDVESFIIQETSTESLESYLEKESPINLNVKQLIKEEVTERDKFTFAKSVLGVCGFIFILIIVLRICYDTDASKDVWTFTSGALVSIVSSILGYYFGTKNKS